MFIKDPGPMTALRTNLVRALRWSERYTKTDMIYLARGGFWLLLGQVISFAASFGLVWLFANFLPKDVYGQYRFVLAVAGVLALATLPGMTQALARAVTAGAARTVFPALGLKIRFGAVGAVGAAGVSGYYFFAGNTELGILFLLTAAFIPFMETLGDYQAYLQGKLDFKRQALYRALQRVLVVAAVGGAILASANIAIIVVTFFATALAANGLFLFLTLRAYPPTGGIDRDDLTYGTRLSFLSMLRIGAQHADKVFLFHFLGAPQVAIYVLATAIPNELSSVFSHVNNLAFPKLVGRDAGELKASLPRKLLVFTLALIAIVALYVLVSPHLFRFFFPEYLSSVPYSQLFALTLLFLPVGVLLQRFYAARDLRVIGILNVAEPLVLLSLYVLLIPIFGIWGAVYAVLGKHVVSALILVYCFALR